MSQIIPQRGHIYRVALAPEVTGLGLVISTVPHNNRYPDCLTIGVQAGRDSQQLYPGWIRLSSGDPAFGYITCNDIGPTGRDELKEDLGELSPDTMREVERVLKMVLGL